MVDKRAIQSALTKVVCDATNALHNYFDTLSGDDLDKALRLVNAFDQTNCAWQIYKARALLKEAIRDNAYVRELREQQRAKEAV